MTIEIVQRLHPFSHLPGVLSLLPKTHLVLQLFPTRVYFFACGASTALFSLSWDIQGPVRDFTVELNLEREEIRVFGVGQLGYFRYVFKRQGDGVILILEKSAGPFMCCHLSYNQTPYRLIKGESLFFPNTVHQPMPAVVSERLSLGSHKMQDWDLIKRRMDFKEIFPIWMRLGQISPSFSACDISKGNLLLLNKCAEMIDENRKQDVLAAFHKLFLASCQGIIVPQLYDTCYQGILPCETPAQDDPSPMPLLTQAARLIRQLFFKEEKNSLSFLPCLPPDFAAGRFLHIQTCSKDRIDFEWTKKQLRRVHIYPQSQRTLQLQFSRKLKSCRVRHSMKDKGKEGVLQEGALCVEVTAGQPLFFDRFQK